jgi:hypothetical protein
MTRPMISASLILMGGLEAQEITIQRALELILNQQTELLAGLYYMQIAKHNSSARSTKMSFLYAPTTLTLFVVDFVTSLPQKDVSR